MLRDDVYESLPPLDIVANSTTMTTKALLDSFHKRGIDHEQLICKLEALLAKTSDSDKFLVHLTLFLHLDDPSLENVIEHDDISPLAPRFSSGSLSLADYSKIVFALKLHNYFIYMLYVLRNKSIGERLIRSIESILIENIKSMDPEDAEGYLMVLALPSKDSIYEDIFDKALTEYLYNPEDVEFEKVVMKCITCFRLIGAITMLREDYEASTMIGELGSLWKYYPPRSTFITHSTVFITLFSLKPSCIKEPEIPLFALLKVIKYIIKAYDASLKQMFKSNENALNLNFIPMDLSWQECMGGYAYISCKIIQKRSGLYLYLTYLTQSSSLEESEYVRKSIEIFKIMAEYKPKLSFEDYGPEAKNLSFEEFMNIFMHESTLRRYEKSWQSQLLSYKELVTTSQGFELVKNYLQFCGDKDIILQLFLLFCENCHEIPSDLAELEKHLLLAQLNNIIWLDKRTELIKTVFSEGFHSKLSLSSFHNDLRRASMQVKMSISTFGPERTAYEDTIYSLTLQDPITTVEHLLSASIRCQIGKPLLLIAPILHMMLNIEGIESGDLLRPTLLLSCLYSILAHLQQLDPSWDFYTHGTNLIINEGLATARDVVKVLRVLLRKQLDKSAHDDCFQKIFAIINKVLLERFKNISIPPSHHLEQEIKSLKMELKEYKEFMRGMLNFTYFYDKGEMSMSIREHCIVLMELIEGKLKEIYQITPHTNDEEDDDEGEILSELKEKLGSCCAKERGLIYIRYPALRTYIKNTPFTPSSQEDSVGAPLIEPYNSGVNDLLSWVSSSCRKEWAGLIEFLHIYYDEEECLQAEGIQSFVNKALLIATKTRYVSSLKFINFYSVYLNSVKDSEEFISNQKSQAQVVLTVLLVIRQLFFYNDDDDVDEKEKRKKGRNNKMDVGKRSNLLRELLLILHSLLDWAMSKGIKYDEDIMIRINKYVGVIPALVKSQWTMRNDPSSKPIYSKVIKLSQELAQVTKN